MFEIREYQEIAINKLFIDVENGLNPIVALPTGSGKTVVLGKFIYKYLEKYPEKNVLVISHTEEILKQDYIALTKIFPGITLGLYSSGLKTKRIFKITIAGIQSIYKKTKLFQNFHLAIIDEAHLIPTKGNGMYRQFFQKVNIKRAGLTGTHFRTGHGYIHKGKGALFDTLSYDLCTMDNFNKLVEDGYLCPLFSKPPNLQLDTDGVKVSAGDYNLKDLSIKFDRNGITKKAVKELIKFGKNYKSWLIFAIDIKHADHINNELNRLGVASRALHSNTSKYRDDIIKEFKNRKIKAVVSVGMVTTGFDAPNIDLICLLRPTKSPVLHVQMNGRGLRTYPEKSHCLVLDFAGNTSRLGPINHISIYEKKKGKKGKKIVKECPECGCLHHPKVVLCNVCKHKFEFKEKITPKSSETEIIRKNRFKWLKVSDIQYHIHSKKDRPDSLRVKYICGLFSLNEYICLEHQGYAQFLARNWVKYRLRSGYSFPETTQELYDISHTLRKPSDIYVEFYSNYPKIKDAIFVE